MEYVAKEVGVKPGYLYHTIDSLHIYKKRLAFLKYQFGRLTREILIIRDISTTCGYVPLSIY